MPDANTTYRKHLQDAEFHMNNAIQSLERAADAANTGRGSHYAQEMAGLSRRLMKRNKHWRSVVKGEQ